MSFSDFEEILKNLTDLKNLSKEEKERIFKYILRKERKLKLIFISIILVIFIFLIIFIPYKFNLFDPVFLMKESETIKNLQSNIELYLSNPIILIQIIYYLLAIFIVTFIFVILRNKLIVKGGNGE